MESMDKRICAFDILIDTIKLQSQNVVFFYMPINSMLNSPISPQLGQPWFCQTTFANLIDKKWYFTEAG